ncbi:MAG: endonuclease MutS2 [Bryobacteraceae bacterium]|nr:endonuclease MutS2 [Bryobacteraceae bacterium]
MNARSLELLEYERMRELLGRYVESPGGRRLLAQMAPLPDRSAASEALAEAAEAMAWLREAQKPAAGRRAAPAPLRFSGLPDVAAAEARLRIEGAVLEPLEIHALGVLLERAAEIRQALAPLGAACPRLAARAARIGDFRATLREISGKILPDGSLADDASPELARIRRDIERQRRLIQESLERFLKAHHEDGLLQEEFVTIRNDRFVVPIVPGARRRLPGVVHAASGSGHTLFLEPLETIELNNELVRLAEEELREIHRILRDLTAALRRHAGEVRDAADALAALDFAFARARFALDFDCTIPSFTPDESPRFALEEARHPLLEDILRRQRRRVVPLSFELDSSRRILLISGPNTGGKTVAMKCAALLALMAQSGVPVPAARAEMPWFDDVLADIGDNQSIEQSLSSFSAHIERIKEIIALATSGSLVLLDELGRATDPDEGGALGVAVLEDFHRRGAFTLASTHLPALKLFGAATPGVVNAAMGFNEETLEPTYRMHVGLPGKSAGLEIAARLGLPERLIERARAAMTERDRQMNQMLAQLESKLAEASARLDELERQRAALEERERRMLEKMERREQARLREIEAAAEAARKQFEKQAQELIESVLSAPEQRRQAEKALRQAARVRREFEESVRALRPGAETAPAAPAAELREGARVRLRDVSQPAHVRKVLPDGRLEVDVGFLRMQVAVSDVLEVLPPAPGAARLPAGVTLTAGPRWDTLTREINVIGRTAEEAREQVDRFLDEAFLAGVTRVRVIHGHGMGILKRAVHELCRAHPHVEKFYPASPSEGGAGATIVELRES